MISSSVGRQRFTDQIVRRAGALLRSTPPGRSRGLYQASCQLRSELRNLRHGRTKYTAAPMRAVDLIVKKRDGKELSGAYYAYVRRK